ncbi:STAS domain-containing protein [bacterium]|nr:STAS domain-containing protein [bacterium]
MITSHIRKNDVVIISLSGSLEIGKQAKLKEEINKLIPTDTKQLVLDLNAVDFIDSTCLGAFVGLSRTLRQKNGDLKIASPCEEVKSILQITRLDKVFQIYPSVDEAVSSYPS